MKMLYEKMTKEEKRKLVDEFVSICEERNEAEIRILYQSDSHFRLTYSITQKFFVEYFVEPVIEMLKPFIETVAKIKKEINANYVQAIQSNPSSLNSLLMTQTMSLGS